MSRTARAIALAMAFTSSACGASAGENACEREMARAALKHGVPLGMLYAVGLTETGRGDTLHPYALNIEGRPVYDTDKQAALRQVEAARRAGARLIDIGCMQINHHFHARNFASVEAMLDPAQNVDYAARFLSRAQGARGQLDKGGRALSRGAQQRSGAEEIRLPRHRQHGRDRLRPMDAGGQRVLPAVTSSHLSGAGS